jgi:hypothetical protein
MRGPFDRDNGQVVSGEPAIGASGKSLPPSGGPQADAPRAFLRPGPCGPEPAPEVTRLVAQLGGGDVVWDAGDRRWRWRDARDVR